MVVTVLLASSALLLVAIAAAVRWSWLVAGPDQWLLGVRDGRLVRAGIGIGIWRRPGDTIVRFTSAVQRVTFKATAPSREQVPFVVEGFALWTVHGEGDGPFVAFGNLGLANLLERPALLRSDKHLLTGPQYHAFQALLSAEVQQLVAAAATATLLTDRAELADRVAERLARLAASLRFKIVQVEVQSVHPAEPALATDLAAREERSIREEGERVRLESHERIKRASIESEGRLAAEAQTRAAAQRLAEEESLRRLSEQRRLREEADLTAQLDRKRREAEAQRDALLLVGEAAEKKSQAVRDLELAMFTSGKVAEGLATLKEARWVSIGGEAPVQSLASMIVGLREQLRAPTTPGHAAS